MADKSILLDIYELIQEAKKKYHDFVNSLPGYIIPYLDRFFAYMDDVWKKAQQAYDDIVFPGDIKDCAKQWMNHVAKPISGALGHVKNLDSQVDDCWSGPAATSYSNMIPKQQAAIKAVEDFANKTADALDEFANAEQDFMFDLLIAVASLVVGMVGAIATAAGVVPGIVAVLGAAVTFVGALESAYKGLNSTTNTQTRTLKESVINNSDDLDNFGWPAARINDGQPVAYRRVR